LDYILAGLIVLRSMIFNISVFAGRSLRATWKESSVTLRMMLSLLTLSVIPGTYYTSRQFRNVDYAGC